MALNLQVLSLLFQVVTVAHEIRLYGYHVRITPVATNL